MLVNHNSSTYDSLLFHLSELNLDSLATDVYFDQASRRYKYKDSNQFASREAVVSLQKKYLATKEKEFIQLANRIKIGEVGIYNELANTLKQIHVSNAIIQRGGIDRITQSDYGVIGNILKKQFYAGKDDETGKPYGLKHLLNDAPGITDARLKQRLELFAESGKITALTLEKSDAIANGLIYAQRFLGNAEHCLDCIYYASLGRQLSEFLPLPKTRCKCKNKCRCTIVYYATPTD